MYESLPAKLRVLRARKGLYLTDAAEMLGISRDTLSDLERGIRRPAAPTLRKLSEGYGVPVEGLMEDPEPVIGKANPPAEPGADLEAEEPALMDLPHVRAWLESQGHLPEDEFLTRAAQLKTPDEAMAAAEAVVALRDSLLLASREYSLRKALFPPRMHLVREAPQEERYRETFRPNNLGFQLGWEIRHEYMRRKIALHNYARDLATGLVAKEASEEERREDVARELEAVTG
jgi:transcriptional regulator with XRE-family HTH domain